MKDSLLGSEILIEICSPIISEKYFIQRDDGPMTYLQPVQVAFWLSPIDQKTVTSQPEPCKDEAGVEGGLMYDYK